MEISLSIVYLFLFLFITWRWRLFRLPGLPDWISPAVLLLKFCAGLTLTWIYTDIYTDRSTADIFKLFDDSAYMYEALDSKPMDFLKMVFGLDNNAPYYDHYYFKMNNWYRPYDLDYSVYNDTRTLIRLNAAIRIFSFGYYSIHVLFWCLISLTGLSLLYRAFHRFLFDRPYWLGFSVFLLPSVVCWGSGVLKEGVVFFLLGLLIYSFFQMIHRGFRVKYLLVIFFAILGFNLLKVHILLSLLPGMIALIVCKLNRYKQVGVVFPIVLFILTILALNIQLIIPSINFMEVLSIKQQAILRLAYYVDSGSAISMNPLHPNVMSFLRNLPEAIINATFRPSIWDADTSLQWFAALENLFLTVFIILSIGLYSKQTDPIKLSVVWFCFSFVLVLFSIMGLTTPILGTLVRYRMPALPFLFIGFILITDTKRLKRILLQVIFYGI